MDLPEVVSIHVGVDLGGGDVGVTEKLLDSSKVRPSLQEMGGKAVTEGVGRYAPG